MNVYTTDKIRNVVLLGHGGAGKTSLVEAMAYLSGITNRMGKISDGNTISDYDKEETKRLFSINTSVVPIIWDDVKINILDTPGYFDFVGEVEEAVSAADAAIIVVSGKNGIEVGTNLHKLYGKKIAPFHLPIRENEEFVGYVNVLQQRAKRWTADGNVEKTEVPEYSKENLGICREALMEAVAETSEEFMDRYFNGEEFSEDEIRQALRVNVAEGSIVPVLMGSNILARGMYTLMVDIVKYLPSPEKRECTGINAKTNEVYPANYDFAKPKSAYVFKTIVDPFIGKYSLIKVNSGVLKADDVLYNQHKDVEEKIGKLYVLRGNKPEEVTELHAGDIGALAKLSKVTTTDTLSTKANPVLYIRTQISTPYTCMRYKAKNKGDEDKISQTLQKLMQEDLTLKNVNDSENGQTLLYGMGDLHLEVTASKLLEKYKVEIELTKPKVAFRETIRKKADVEYKYKKQSGGHGQYGHVKMTFEPSGDLETPYVFEQTVVGGAVPKNYYPAVEKGLAEAVLKGPMAAYPVVGVKAVLYDGSYHPVDSSEMAFKTAAIQAFKKGFMEASPVLLEPISSLKVIVPDKYTGDVMGDLNKRRGRVLGMNPIDGGKQEILADVPTMELYGYTTSLRAITGGSGDYSYEFARYEQAPSDIQEKQIKNKDGLEITGEDQKAESSCMDSGSGFPVRRPCSCKGIWISGWETTGIIRR